MIVGVLEGDKLAFKSTTHERNLYIGTIDGERVLVCRQVDDFAIASKSRAAAEKLIAQVLQTHSWEKPSLKESDHHDSVPMSADVSKKLCTLSGPAEGTHEHAALAKKTGFSYCQVLGELIYACVVCRLDIGCAITFLSLQLEFVDLLRLSPHLEVVHERRSQKSVLSL
jgi:hypothetical protein